MRHIERIIFDLGEESAAVAVLFIHMEQEGLGPETSRKLLSEAHTYFNVDSNVIRSQLRKLPIKQLQKVDHAVAILTYEVYRIQGLTVAAEFLKNFAQIWP
jgi:hypothetical protein